MRLKNEILVAENVEVIFPLITAEIERVTDELFQRIPNTDIYQKFRTILYRSPLFRDSSIQLGFILPADNDHLKLTTQLVFPYNGRSKLIIHTHHRKEMEQFGLFVDEIRPIIATLACIPRSRT